MPTARRKPAPKKPTTAETLVSKLTSRKFWLTTAAFITAAAHGDLNAAYAIVAAYLAAEGVADLKGR